MAFKLNGNPLAVDVAFSHNDIQYPANWLRLSTSQEKKDLGITEVADDPVLDADGNQVVTLGVKSVLKAQEKVTAGYLLAKYDWYVVRKSEKSTAIPTAITTYRDGVRTACDTREKEIDACSDTAALVTLYGTKEDGTPNMTQYPKDPNS